MNSSFDGFYNSKIVKCLVWQQLITSRNHSIQRKEEKRNDHETLRYTQFLARPKVEYENPENKSLGPLFGFLNVNSVNYGRVRERSHGGCHILVSEKKKGKRPFFSFVSPEASKEIITRCITFFAFLAWFAPCFCSTQGVSELEAPKATLVYYLRFLGESL